MTAKNAESAKSCRTPQDAGKILNHKWTRIRAAAGGAVSRELAVHGVMPPGVVRLGTGVFDQGPLYIRAKRGKAGGF